MIMAIFNHNFDSSDTTSSERESFSVTNFHKSNKRTFSITKGDEKKNGADNCFQIIKDAIEEWNRKP